MSVHHDFLQELRASNLPYNMSGMLQLDAFNPCTWDIFLTPEKGTLVHLRVYDATFGMREGSFQVKSFSQCQEQQNGSWVPSKYTRPAQLRRFLYNEIVASHAVRDNDGRDCAVVFPKKAMFASEWIGTVFYPDGIDPDNPATLQVVGWEDKINPIWNNSTMNGTKAVEGTGGIGFILGPQASIVATG